MPDVNGPRSPDELPDLPAEWGRVVVPDDASALVGEAEQLRRELRLWSTHPPRRKVARGTDAFAVPLMILLAGVLTTLAGLVAVTWSSTAPPAATVRQTPSSGRTPDVVGRPLPALDLVDSNQEPVPLRSLLPAVILLTGACPCPERVLEAVAAAPPGVTVVVVADGSGPASAPGAVRLADPAGGLRALVSAGSVPGAIDAILVDRTGVVVGALPAATSVVDHREDLTRLADAGVGAGTTPAAPQTERLSPTPRAGR